MDLDDNKKWLIKPVNFNVFVNKFAIFTRVRRKTMNTPLECHSTFHFNYKLNIFFQQDKQPESTPDKITKIPTKSFDKNSRPIATTRSLPKPPPVPLKRTLGAS